MRFAGPRISDEDDRLGAVDISAFGQFANLWGRNQRGSAEIEIFQRLNSRQTRFLDPALDSVTLTLIDLRTQQFGQIGQIWLLLLYGILGQSLALSRDRRQS